MSCFIDTTGLNAEIIAQRFVEETPPMYKVPGDADMALKCSGDNVAINGGKLASFRCEGATGFWKPSISGCQSTEFWSKIQAERLQANSVKKEDSVSMITLGALACIPGALLFSIAAIFWGIHHKRQKKEMCRLVEIYEEGNKRRRRLREMIMSAEGDVPEEFAQMSETSSEDDKMNLILNMAAETRKNENETWGKGPQTGGVSAKYEADQSSNSGRTGTSMSSRLTTDYLGRPLGSSMVGDDSSSDEDGKGIKKRKISIDEFGNVKDRLKKKLNASKLLRDAHDLNEDVYDKFGGRVKNLKKPTVEEQNKKIEEDDARRGSHESLTWSEWAH